MKYNRNKYIKKKHRMKKMWRVENENENNNK